MGENHNFKGKWITSAEFCDLKPVNVFHRQLDTKEIITFAPKNSHILFRKKFKASANKMTRIYISADDYYKLYINGKFVCQGPSPGYNFHYYYNEFDISEYICEGENTIAVHTYYQGLINRVWQSGDDRHGMILDIVQNGEVILCSDEEFLYSYHSGFSDIGQFGYRTQFAEKYTSGTAHEGFEQADYDDGFWKKSAAKKYVDYKLYPQPSKQLEFERIEPARIIKNDNGVQIDFGGMYVGYLCAEASGSKYDEVELLFGQELNEDGSVCWKIRANCDYRELWQLSGGDDKLNEFDYKAFRYVQINLPEKCRLRNVYLTARHYPFELKAKPNTDDEMLLKIWNLCVDSLKYGTQEVIQDCMDREKGNYLGDGCYSALSHTVLTHDASIFKKLFDDSMRSSFINKGLMTCASCSLMQEIAEYPLMMYFTLYAYYQFSGDKEYLKEKYEQLCEILDYYKQEYMQDNNLLSNLDKWCVVEWPKEYRDGYVAEITEGKICTDVHNVINAHFIGAVIYCNKIAKVLGYPQYMDEDILTGAYYREFYDEEKHLFKDMANSEHISLISNVFPLMYGIYKEKETEDAIISLIKERGFTSVMLFGAFPILYGLKRIGRKNLMYECLKDEKAWYNMLNEGATRTFEGWSKNSKWNTSLFHLTLSYAALFLTDWETF